MRAHKRAHSQRLCARAHTQSLTLTLSRASSLPPALPPSARPPSFPPSLCSATLWCVIANAAFGALGFAFFGDATDSVVLNNLGQVL